MRLEADASLAYPGLPIIPALSMTWVGRTVTCLVSRAKLADAAWRFDGSFPAGAAYEITGFRHVVDDNARLLVADLRHLGTNTQVTAPIELLEPVA